jgi:hypothetical protein
MDSPEYNSDELVDMNVGVCQITLLIPENSSLKEKRQFIRPIITRIKNNFNVSVAEVDHRDSWKLATISVAFVSNDRRYTDKVLSEVVNFVRGGFSVEILDCKTEIISI